VVDEKQMVGTEEELEEMYGPLAWKVYNGIRSEALFKITSSTFFIEEFIEFYAANIQLIDKDKIASKNMRTLITLLPSFKELRALLPLLHKYSPRQMVMYKLILDMMICYYKKAEEPVYKKLRREVIPLALAFYEGISGATLIGIISELISCGCINGKAIYKNIETQWLLLKNNKKDAIEYYRTKLRDIENIAGATDDSMFCM